MLEIILLFGLARHLAAVARNKGRSSAWAALGVVFWIGGEVFGFVVGALAGMEGIATYGPALVCAVLGVGVAATIIYLLPAVCSDDTPGTADYPSVTKSRFG